MPVEAPPLEWGTNVRDLAGAREHVRKIAQSVRSILRGGSNSGGVVTLTAGVATTTITDDRIQPASRIFLSPTTANASAAIPTTWISCGIGSCTINHANNGQTDRTFGWELKA